MIGKMPVLLSSRQPDLARSWFNSALGLSLVRDAQRRVTPLLTSHIGVRGLFVRPCAETSPLLSGNMLQSTVSLYQSNDGLAGDLRCRAESLPFESETLSLIYLLYATDVAVDPSALVTECARVLLPEGVLFVIRLSTTSLWRLSWGRGVPRPLAERQMHSMLVDAGLSIEQELGIGPLWPRQLEPSSAEASVAESRWVPNPLRPSVLVVARKRRAGMTAIGLRKAPAKFGSHVHAR